MTARNNAGRLDYLDAVRAFALLLGIIFHASLSFMPFFMGWAVMDVSTDAAVPAFVLVSHSFRMGLFFLIAGYFSHMTFHRNGFGAFAKSRAVRIVVPFVVGWFLLRPLLVSGWIMGAASLRGDVDVMAGLGQGFASLSGLPNGLFTGSHLWFLYYLTLLTVLTLLLRWILARGRDAYTAATVAGDRLLSRVARMRLPALIFVVPTAAALWFMNNWGMDTPDQALRPHVPVTLVYWGFYLVGWMLHRNAESLVTITQLSRVRSALALVAGIGALYLSQKQMDYGNAHYTWYRAGFAVCYAALMWSLALLTVGVFRKLYSKANAVVRYVADSSYWLYLVHLPIVVWLQIAVAELPWHWSAKLAAISVATIGISLLMYDLFVRSTFIGKILNGRRRERVLFRLPARQRVAAEA